MTEEIHNPHMIHKVYSNKHKFHFSCETLSLIKTWLTKALNSLKNSRSYLYLIWRLPDKNDAPKKSVERAFLNSRRLDQIGESLSFRAGTFFLSWRHGMELKQREAWSKESWFQRKNSYTSLHASILPNWKQRY